MFRIPRWHRAGRAGDVASLAVAAVVLHALAGPAAALAAGNPHPLKWAEPLLALLRNLEPDADIITAAKRRHDVSR